MEISSCPSLKVNSENLNVIHSGASSETFTLRIDISSLWDWFQILFYYILPDLYFAIVKAIEIREVGVQTEISEFQHRISSPWDLGTS